MNILLTNDDGINAEGLLALKEILSQDHEVFIIAPDKERSACSNYFTVREDVLIKQIDHRSYSVSGFPSDCVGIGIHSDLIPNIDMVISGINHGPNLGDDIHFSGTVAGARTAHIFGKPGIAISIDSYHKPSIYLTEAAIFIKDYLNKHTPRLDVFFNINYPNISFSEIKGVVYTFLSKRYYKDSYIKKEITETSNYSMKLIGEIITDNIHGSDSNAVVNGYISITPLTIDSTDYNILKIFNYE